MYYRKYITAGTSFKIAFFALHLSCEQTASVQRQKLITHPSNESMYVSGYTSSWIAS
jgi:hypothetical protein